ncbi:transcription termination/antitermination protein NusG [Roseospira navarrensis]|uniref:Transcriptional activator RfaH n=1 Tax=Roseospira navarrensis TaxID=140058 RepID=A0A7X1ZG71_9PROT|nr:transcription termination/antitermination NusG family protein [Roseospira navarrensis]MQX37429.1 transcriptional activator RfaH [Roseospira navarrensis]
MKRWYAVHTQARAEDKATFHLRRQGYEVYCPRLARTRRHARRVETVLRPLFPRYLFTSLDVDRQPWHAINGTVGVQSLIGWGERPAPLPDGLVEALMVRESEAGDGPPPAPTFHPGEHVVIEDGPFRDLVARFETMADADRVTVLLDLLGRTVRVTTHHTGIRQAG